MAGDVYYEVALVWALQHLAAVGALRPNTEKQHARVDRERAARLLGYADARLAALEALREYTEQQEYEKVNAVLRQTFNEDELSRSIKEGRGWTEHQAVAEGLLI